MLTFQKDKKKDKKKNCHLPGLNTIIPLKKPTKRQVIAIARPATAYLAIT